jgi:hypothetical protein
MTNAKGKKTPKISTNARISMLVRVLPENPESSIRCNFESNSMVTETKPV